MSIDPIEGYSIANVFFKEDKDRFTTQAIQRDLVPSRLRLLTVATGLDSRYYVSLDCDEFL